MVEMLSLALTRESQIPSPMGLGMGMGLGLGMEAKDQGHLFMVAVVEINARNAFIQTHRTRGVRAESGKQTRSHHSI